MSTLNGSFETAGARRYLADSWTVAEIYFGDVLLFAEFAVDEADQVTRGDEAFESGWGAWIAAFSGFFVDLEPALFDLASSPKDYEDFEDLWGAGPAILTATVEGPYDLDAGDTLLISVGGGTAQTITFNSTSFLNIDDARPGEVAVVINLGLVDAHAEVVGAKLRLFTEAVGPGASIEVTGGTAAAKLGFSGGVVVGTPSGGPFMQTIEFGFAAFGSANEQVDTFESEWPGAVDLTADAGDTSGRITFAAFGSGAIGYDNFEAEWGTIDHTSDPNDTSGRITFAQFVGPSTAEDYEGTWDSMTTI